MIYEIFARMKKGERFTVRKIIDDFKTNRVNAYAAMARINGLKGVRFDIKTRMAAKQVVAEREYYYVAPKNK